MAVAISWITNPQPGETGDLCFPPMQWRDPRTPQRGMRALLWLCPVQVLPLTGSRNAHEQNRWLKMTFKSPFSSSNNMKRQRGCADRQTDTPLQTGFCTLMLHLLVLQHHLRHQPAFSFLSPSCEKPLLIWMSCQVLNKKSCSSQHFRVHWGKIKG